MLARLVFATALLGATCAWGEQPESPPQEATAAEIARASALADRLIAEAGAEAFFANTTDSGVAQVTHVPSGMSCLFEDNGAGRIHIFDSGTNGPPRGDDIGCVSRTLDIDLTLYATRYRPLPSQRVVMADAVNAIRSRWPGATPFEGDTATASTEGREPPLAEAFIVETAQGPRLTMALVSHVGEWSYKARATGPSEDPMLLSLVVGVIFSGALLNAEGASE